jgi:archaellum component FlaG (FlaF/FlaG flagellin family)
MLLALFQAANASPNWNEAAIAKATIVIAVATVLYLVATVLLWLTTRRSVNLTRDIFEASHRPYVSITEIEAVGLNGDDSEEDETPDRVAIVFTLKNVGNVPAHDLRYEVRVSVDGSLMPALEEEEEPVALLFPGDTGHFFIETSETSQVDTIRNAKSLSLLITYSYKGATQQRYSYKEKASYDSEKGDFGMIKVSAT